MWTTFFYMPAFPALFAYLIAIVFVFYWFDKFLFLRFYRVPRNSDEKPIGYAVKLLKYSFLWHGIAGTFILSNEGIFTSKTYFTAQVESANALLQTWTGGRLLIADRFVQGHVILFWAVTLTMLLLIWFEDDLLALGTSLPGLKWLYQRPLSKMEAITDDFYSAIRPHFLIKQYERAREAKEHLMAFIASHQHKTEFYEEFRSDIASYLEQTIQKEQTLAVKIRELATAMGYPKFHSMEDRCEKVLDHIEKANRVANSRMRSPIQSYDYRDNERYQAMLALEGALQEPDETEEGDQEALYERLKECFKEVVRKQDEYRSHDKCDSADGSSTQADI